MFKSPSFRAFNRSNGSRRSQNNNDTMTIRDMSSTGETLNNANTIPQRLTKPRTNTKSTLKNKGETSSSYSTPNRAHRGSFGAGDDYRQDARLSYTNDSPISFTGSASFYHADSPNRSATNLTNNDLRSRNPSSTSVNSANRNSALVESSEVDVAAAIALLQELKKRASPEDLVALHKALLPSRNFDRAISPVKPETREVEEPLSPLIRRSSLLPAGIKTRLSRELLRNFSDQNIPARSSSNGPSHSPNLEKPLNFEALDLANEALEARAARAATPSDFTQIGTYKLGSLRVTNGAASPEPGLLLNMAEKAGGPESVGGDGFVTADEGESIVEESRPVRNYAHKPRESARSKSRARAPLRADTFRDSSDEETSRRTSRQPSVPRLPQRASGAARDSAEIDPIMTTAVSRLSTVHDESPVENTGGREDALRKLNGGIGPSNGQKYLVVGRPPMHAKSDSGYSSKASRPNSIVKENNVDEFLMAAIDAAEQAEHSRRLTLDKSRQDNIPTAQAADIQTMSATPRAEKHRSMPSFFSNSRKTASSTSLNTISSSPVTPPAKQSRKLQKTRPQANLSRSMTVQEVPTPREAQPEDVPVVSEDTLVNFSRRLNRTPEMAHLDRTFTSVDETLQDRRESTEEEDGRRGRGRSRKTNLKSKATDAEASPGGSKRRRSFSIFRFRSRSRSKSQHRHQDEVIVLSVEDEPLPTFSDFGTVAQSLGSSPYDMATRRVKEVGNYDPSKPLFHPHEISYAIVDERIIGEVARERSRDRAREEARDRSRSQSRSRGRPSTDSVAPEKSSGTEKSTSNLPSRGKSRRSLSAHATVVPRLPETPKKAEISKPIRPISVRVGTIDFGTGVAQGRLAPMLTTSEKAKTKRRTQSVSPRTRYYATSPVIPEEPVPQTPTPKTPKTPKVPAHADESLSLPPTPTFAALPTFEPLPELPKSLTPANERSSRPVSLSSPVHTPKRPELPCWETQTRVWREKKQSIGEGLSSPVSERKSFVTPKTPSLSFAQHYSPTTQSPRNAPSVVVSRYITPLGSEFAMHLGDDNAEDPYNAFRADNPTDLRPAQEDVSRTDSSSTYRTAASGRSQDSFASSDSAKYRAYRPADAVPITNLTSPRSQSRPRHSTEPKRQSVASKEDQRVLFDRFSGGLAYGWERGAGFGGSAGTRGKSDNKASRKSVVLSENFGVDLSDVPVFYVKQ